MPNDDTPSILDSVFAAAKKLPGQVVGGGVDIGNMILGGYANIADMARGKEITRQVGEGLVPKPVGGSEQLNGFFGLDQPSKGLVEDSASAVLNALNPAMAVKSLALAGAKGAVIVAAHVVKDADSMLAATRALRQGETASKVFEETGMYRGPLDNKLRAVIPDQMASINPDVLRPVPPGGNVTEMRPGPVDRLSDFYLPDVLNHPELYNAYPYLGSVKVIADPRKGMGEASAFASGPNPRISMGPQRDVEAFKRTLLHEVQHHIQEIEGFMIGGNPGQFLNPSVETLDRSFNKIQEIAGELKSGLAKKYGTSEDTIAHLTDPSFGALRKNLSEVLTDPDFTSYVAARKAQALVIAKKGAAYDSYKSIAGEAEARAVERQASIDQYANPNGEDPFFPLDLYDIEPKQLIPSPGDEHKMMKTSR